MDLIYRPDFWSFYNDNRKIIDPIIIYHSNRYKETVDTNEMFQEILLRLANSDVLTRYNPEESSLKTYVTTRIRGYASHVSEETSRIPPYITIEYYNHACDKGDDKQVNKPTIKEHIDHDQHPTFDETINDTLYAEEIMEILKEHLDKTHYLIACLYLLDCYTCKEIYQYINKFSYNVIVKKINKIKSLIRRIFYSHNNIYGKPHKPVRNIC